MHDKSWLARHTNGDLHELCIFNCEFVRSFNPKLPDFQAFVDFTAVDLEVTIKADRN
jgi:hypothetical protein